jgi:3-oxoacyl-(acyl-carrier-protein) synthase
MGIATPAGLSVPAVWQRWLASESAITSSHRFDPKQGHGIPAGEVPAFDIRPSLRIAKNEKFMTPAVRFAIYAAVEAVKEAQLDLNTIDPYRIAIYTGSGQTGLESSDFFANLEISAGVDDATDFANMGGRAARMLDRYFSLRTLSNAGLGLLSIELGAKGPSDNFVQDDTASATAIACGFRDLEEGRCDVAIVGGYDSLLTPSNFLAYDKASLLSRSDAAFAYRPFDRHRDGLVLGEGAGFLVLERAEDASKRGAPIVGQLIGSGSAIEVEDSAHAKASDTALRAAIRDAADGCTVDGVIGHGIGTRDDDRRESSVLSSVIGNEMPVTGLKSLTGYMGAATAAVEFIMALQAARERVLPPVPRLDTVDEDCELDLVRRTARSMPAINPTILNMSWSWFGACAVLASRPC